MGCQGDGGASGVFRACLRGGSVTKDFVADVGDISMPENSAASEVDCCSGRQWSLGDAAFLRFAFWDSREAAVAASSVRLASPATCLRCGAYKFGWTVSTTGAWKTRSAIRTPRMARLGCPLDLAVDETGMTSSSEIESSLATSACRRALRFRLTPLRPLECAPILRASSASGANFGSRSAVTGATASAEASGASGGSFSARCG